MPNIGKVTTGISLAIAAWAILWPYPPEAFAAVLMATPWAALVLIAAADGRLKLYPDWRKPGPAVPQTATGLLRSMWVANFTGQTVTIPRPARPPAIAGLMIIPCGVLIWKTMFGGHLMGLVPLLPYMAGLGVLLAGAACMVDKSVARAEIGKTWLFAAAFVYGVCGALLVNQDFEQAPARDFATSILRVDPIKGGDFLALAPWDSAAVGYSRSVLVSPSVYGELSGGAVCAAEHPGALGVRWFELERCAIHKTPGSPPSRG